MSEDSETSKYGTGDQPPAQISDPLLPFLDRLSLEKYHESLSSREVSLQKLAELSEQELEEQLGLSKWAARTIKRNIVVGEGESLEDREKAMALPDIDTVDLLAHFLKRLGMEDKVDLLKEAEGVKNHPKPLEFFDFEKSKGVLDDDASEYFDRIVRYLMRLGFSEEEATNVRENTENHGGELVEKEKELIAEENKAEIKKRPAGELLDFLTKLKLEAYFEIFSQRDLFLDNIRDLPSEEWFPEGVPHGKMKIIEKKSRGFALPAGEKMSDTLSDTFKSRTGDALYIFLNSLGLSMYWEDLGAENATFDSLEMFTPSQLESFSIPEEAAEVILASKWKPVLGSLPPNSFIAGSTCDGRPVYVARVWHKGESMYTPRIGSFSEIGDVSFMCYNREQKATECEVLTGSGYSWVATSYYSVPEGALQWGGTYDIYVTRVEMKGEHCIGTLNPYDGCCKFLYNGDVRGDHFYEVL